ncbi:hypothetical protein KP509_25G031100 [Ceratopteris richardii]|uniref:Uncharacterized protein n=1 Tax=Ceratopteris richardii TaxID=49495 RepID=A0A8T2RQE2_CERRI|nr:hypothetical protein KP509_25G031100 [Ceratopteris richardii]
MEGWSSSEQRPGQGRTGFVPRYAGPWIEMGRLTEREKWQAFTAQLLRDAINAEMDGLKRGVGDSLGRLAGTGNVQYNSQNTSRWFPGGRSSSLAPDSKAHVFTSIDASKAKIASLLAEYIDFFTAEQKALDREEDALIQEGSKETGLSLRRQGPAVGARTV